MTKPAKDHPWKSKMPKPMTQKVKRRIKETYKSGDAGDYFTKMGNKNAG